MSLLVPITLSLAIAILTVFLVMLLIQARRTATAVERLANSAIQDLRQVSEDIHEVRNQVEQITGLARTILEPPSVLAQVVSGVVRSLPALFSRQSNPAGILEVLVTGLRTALHLFRHRKATTPKEETHE
jgi:conjugal transfer/entry exclusion protein